MKKIFSLLTAVLFAGTMWAAEGDVLYECTFPVSTAQSYVMNATITRASKDWLVSVYQINNSVFYLGCNSNNTSKGVLAGTENNNPNNAGAWDDVIAAWNAADSKYGASVHAYAMLFDNAYSNVGEVTFTWAGGNNAFVVFLFGDKGSGLELLDSTYYATSGASTAGNVTWTGDATNFSSFAIVARPGTKTTNATDKTLRASTFKIKEGAAASCTNTVAITKGAETNGTYSLNGTEVCGDGDGGDILISKITPAAGYEFDEITTSASGTVDNANKKVTGIKAATTITVKFKALPKYTVSFSTGVTATQADITETLGGQGIELPTGPEVCDTYTFAGWAEAAVGTETTTAPTLLAAGANYKPAANVTLYAVYSRSEESGTTGFTSYSKVTSAPNDWSGKYLLSTGTYTATGEISSKHLTATSYTPGNEEKTEYEFTLAKIADDQYSILLPDGENYLGYASSTDFSTSTTEPTSTTTAYLWNPSTSEIANVKTTDRKLCTNASNTDIRPYQNVPSGGAKICLYKRNEGNTSTTYYISVPNCSTTALDNTEVEGKAVKVLKDGVLYIEKNGRIYNMQGQIVK